MHCDTFECGTRDFIYFPAVATSVPTTVASATTTAIQTAPVCFSRTLFPESDTRDRRNPSLSPTPPRTQNDRRRRWLPRMPRSSCGFLSRARRRDCNIINMMWVNGDCCRVHAITMISRSLVGCTAASQPPNGRGPYASLKPLSLASLHAMFAEHWIFSINIQNTLKRHLQTLDKWLIQTAWCPVNIKFSCIKYVQRIKYVRRWL